MSGREDQGGRRGPGGGSPATSFVPAGDGTYVQTIVITGGNGRFAGATGSATITGNFDFGRFVYDGHLEGTISQPGPRH